MVGNIPSYQVNTVNYLRWLVIVKWYQFHDKVHRKATWGLFIRHEWDAGKISWCLKKDQSSHRRKMETGLKSRRRVMAHCLAVIWSMPSCTQSDCDHLNIAIKNKDMEAGRGCGEKVMSSRRREYRKNRSITQCTPDWNYRKKDEENIPNRI